MSVTFSDNNKTDASLQTLSAKLQDSIRNIAMKENYIVHEVTVKHLNAGKNNFLGKIYEIDIVGKTVDGQKDTNIFVKESMNLNDFRWLAASKLFPNEVLIYKELSKVIEFLQDRADVPKEDRFKMAKAYEETDESAIILENLSKRGFKMYEKMEPTPFKFAELAVKELAKYHAFSFIIEKEIPEFYENKIKPRYSIFTYNEHWRMLMRKVCAHVASLGDDEAKERMEKFLPVYFEKLSRYHNNRTGVKCTLTHGDYKKNNLMVRLEEGEPVELIMLDFQLLDYGCPIKDLMMFIFTQTDPEFRRKHMTELKEIYFETLSRLLTYFDMDVEAVYPRREFEKVFTEWLDFGLMSTLFYSVFSFASYDGLDFDKLLLTEAPFTPDRSSDRVFRALVEDFTKWGIL